MNTNIIEPDRVTWEQVKQALRGLRIDTTRLVQVTIGPDAITVVRERADEDGRRIAAGDTIANVTTVVGITGRPDACTCCEEAVQLSGSGLSPEDTRTVTSRAGEGL